MRWLINQLCNKLRGYDANTLTHVKAMDDIGHDRGRYDTIWPIGDVSRCNSNFGGQCIWVFTRSTSDFVDCLTVMLSACC